METSEKVPIFAWIEPREGITNPLSRSPHACPSKMRRVCLQSEPPGASRRLYDYNDYRMAKSIEDSIDFAAKQQVWQRMIL